MWTTLVTQPLFNLLVGLYNVLGSDLGLAIIALTILIRIALYPLSQSALKSQAAMQAIQPRIKALQQQYKNDRERLARETMALYREQKVNPFASCFPVLIQLPFLIGIFWALRAAVDANGGGSFDLLYSFVDHPGTLQSVAFGFLELARPNIALAILSGAAQWWVTRMLMTNRPTAAVAAVNGKDEDVLAMMNKQMMFTMPIMTVIFGITLPAGLTLYWLVTTLLQGVQQKMLFRSNPTPPAPGSPQHS